MASLCRLMGCFAYKLFMHDSHADKDCQQIDRIQTDTDMVGDETEQRRHQQCSDIGAGHLDTNECLRSVGAKVSWCGVDDAWIDRCTAEADKDKTCHGGIDSKWQ